LFELLQPLAPRASVTRITDAGKSCRCELIIGSDFPLSGTPEQKPDRPPVFRALPYPVRSTGVPALQRGRPALRAASMLPDEYNTRPLGVTQSGRAGENIHESFTNFAGAPGRCMFYHRV
jgi:hypothetical protein